MIKDIESYVSIARTLLPRGRARLDSLKKLDAYFRTLTKELDELIRDESGSAVAKQNMIDQNQVHTTERRGTHDT